MVIPNGLIANFFGPKAGRRHDATMLHDSNLVNTMATDRKYFKPDGTQYRLILRTNDFHLLPWPRLIK